ncbi:hypothetical protein AB4455_24220 [Vibrio sp. 10N.261.46.E12]|uniref:hypothetical protein n=1 Tax=unclassified Vibrio TaxID=2614977 RepID=UPI0009780A42|nr:MULTISPECIES: hypothetical protein [unclassified Vibrio]OMO35220.1 hypothetical protein BH584_09795 [Vibrio sp. 10N.261.45.E1]PMJ25171.1 hypothetical protein BCU27_11590 [Vibrio sp. 10N.286.45.B6]PML88358.1 hypothetical protein BCT66_00430 [Vibrio sp. 10N.261.49.E11]PMM70866.1 hypothetical protein BCT48_09265 [Vibrio sp. 10N.261.46.F12]PMM80934.1 hypothetical protein BCT46_17095 [Vibrio sp. 10N.261.46.E8]
MMFLRLLSVLTIGLLSSGVSAAPSQIIGAWSCGVTLPVSWLDAVSIYAPNGKSTGVANSLTLQAEGDELIEFDLYVEGTWLKDGSVLNTNIEHFDIVPKNPETQSKLHIIEKTLVNSGLLNAEQKIIILNDDTLKTESKDGIVDTCKRAISAQGIREKS